MHDDFFKNAEMLLQNGLINTEFLFVSQKQQWLSDFAKQFLSICSKIIILQNESNLPAISQMEYTLLYTNFIERRYIAEIWVYNDKRYLDINQCMVGEYDISFLFVYFDELWDKLLSSRKRYVGKVTAPEVAAFMMQSLPMFYSYLISIARFSITDCVDVKPFIDIIKNGKFRINVGDYMAGTEPVFTLSKSKNAETLAKWFEERLGYMFEDCSGLDFTGRTFTFTNFRYSQFSNSILNGVSFDASLLAGVNFRNASMENCKLIYCSIYEADFSYATLRGASFTFARGRAGLPDENEWRHVGFLPVSFRYTNLTNADFKWADLTGADFTGAILTGADFTGAILDGAIFDGCVGKED